MENIQFSTIVNMCIGAILTVATWWLKSIKISIDKMSEKLDSHGNRICKNEVEIDNIQKIQDECKGDRTALHSRITTKIGN